MKIRVAFKRFGRKQLPDIYEKALKQYIAEVPKAQIQFKQLSGSQGRNPLGAFLTLYEKIKREGFVKGAFVKGVTEKGHLLVRGGYHRLSIGHALGTPSILAEVKLSPRAEKFYRLMLAMQGKGKTHMYTPVDHWAVSNWSFERGTNRPGLVMKGLVGEGPFSFLDLGCNVGHVVHGLAAKGHRVTGIDRSDQVVYCAKFLADYYVSIPQMVEKWPLELGHVAEWQERYAEYKKPTFVCASLDTYIEKRRRRVDYALFLSVYRWMVKEPNFNVYAFMRKLDKLTKHGIFVDARASQGALAAVVAYTRFKQVRKLGVERHGSAKYQREMFLCTEEKS